MWWMVIFILSIVSSAMDPKSQEYRSLLHKSSKKFSTNTVGLRRNLLYFKSRLIPSESLTRAEVLQTTAKDVETHQVFFLLSEQALLQMSRLLNLLRY